MRDQFQGRFSEFDRLAPVFKNYIKKTNRQSEDYFLEQISPT